MPTNLLLLHGALGAASQLEPLRHLLQSDFHVHAFDLSGHGANTYSGPLTMERFGNDILSQMDALGWQQSAAFGYSMGGYAALTLAAAHPGRISALLTLGSKWHWSPAIAATQVGMLQPDKLLEKVPRYAAALEQVHTGQGWKPLLQGTAQLLTGLGDEGGFAEAAARGVHIPVRILWGSDDRLVTEQESQRLAAALPIGSFKTLPAVPHPLEKVNLDMLAGEIAQFTAQAAR